MNINPTLGPTFMLSAIWFSIGFAAQKRIPRASWWVGAALAIPCFLAILYYVHLFDRSVWYYEARALRYADFAFAGIGFLGGVAYRWQLPETWLARIALPLCTTVVLFVPFMKPVLDPLSAKELHDRCAGNVCLQSTYS